RHAVENSGHAPLRLAEVVGNTIPDVDRRCSALRQCRANVDHLPVRIHVTAQPDGPGVASGRGFAPTVDIIHRQTAAYPDAAHRTGEMRVTVNFAEYARFVAFVQSQHVAEFTLFQLYVERDRVIAAPPLAARAEVTKPAGGPVRAGRLRVDADSPRRAVRRRRPEIDVG